MNKIIVGLLITVLIGFISCKKETNQTEENSSVAMTEVSFGVRGNCGMCKKTIEKAANGVEGVAEADWNVDEKMIKISFNGAKTSTMDIHNAIAKAGYDTEKVAGSKTAYKELPKCCQYDHAMKIGKQKESHEGHDHDDHTGHNH